jgi:hypothetical protein
MILSNSRANGGTLAPANRTPGGGGLVPRRVLRALDTAKR